MKRISLLLLAGVCLFAAAACSDDDDEVQSAIEIITADTGFEFLGGDGTIVFKATSAVTAVSDKEWVKITSSTADSVSFSVDANDETLLRTAKITVSLAEGNSRDVTILQKGLSPFIEDADSEVIYYTTDAGTMEGAITPTKYLDMLDANWTVEAKDGWVTPSKETNGKISLDFTENTTRKSRTTQVNIKAKGATVASVSVVQCPLNHDYFLGNWTMHSQTITQAEGPQSPQTNSVTITESEDGTNFVIGGLLPTLPQITVNAIYKEDPNTGMPYFTITAQDTGWNVYTEAGEVRTYWEVYFIHTNIKFSVNINEDEAWLFVYDHNTETIVAKQNDWLASAEYNGFGIGGEELTDNVFKLWTIFSVFLQDIYFERE